MILGTIYKGYIALQWPKYKTENRKIQGGQKIGSVYDISDTQ